MIEDYVMPIVVLCAIAFVVWMFLAFQSDVENTWKERWLMYQKYGNGAITEEVDFRKVYRFNEKQEHNSTIILPIIMK